jgi:hypothetical protein
MASVPSHHPKDAWVESQAAGVQAEALFIAVKYGDSESSRNE